MSATSLPANWRQRLPAPAVYYAGRVGKLGAVNAAGWAPGQCPFHEDRAPSFSVHLYGERGGWRCFSGCGHGDMVSFHQRLTGMAFKATVRDLLGLAL